MTSFWVLRDSGRSSIPISPAELRSYVAEVATPEDAADFSDLLRLLGIIPTATIGPGQPASGIPRRGIISVREHGTGFVVERAEGDTRGGVRAASVEWIGRHGEFVPDWER